MSVARCMEEVSSSEFVEWIMFLDKQVDGFHRNDYFLAQIALEVRRSYIKNPNKVKLKDFMLTFSNKPVEAYSMEKSKAAWLTSVGLKKEAE